MPIVDVEMVIRVQKDDEVSREQITRLADTLGKVLGGGPKGTWVRLRYLPDSQRRE